MSGPVGSGVIAATTVAYHGGMHLGVASHARPTAAGRPAPPSATLRRVYGAFALGNVAQGIPFVLVMAAIERRDGGAGWLAAVAVARLLPYLVCSPAAGAVSGRLRFRDVIAVAGGARAVATIALGVALAADAPHLALVSLLFVVVALGTPTYPALMRSLSSFVPPGPRRDRCSAVAAGIESVAFWSGPALGGVLIVAGESVGIAVSVALLGASAVLARSVAADGGTDDPVAVRRAISGSMQWLFAPPVRPAMLSVIGSNVLAGLLATLLVRVASELPSGGEEQYALLSLVQGGGAVVAFVALIGPIRTERNPLNLLLASGAAVTVLALGGRTTAVVACATLGAGVLAAEVMVTRAIGRAVPGPYVAPAIGMLDAWMVAAMTTGAVIAPRLVALVGLRPTLALTGVTLPALAVAAARPPIRDRQPDVIGVGYRSRRDAEEPA